MDREAWWATVHGVMGYSPRGRGLQSTGLWATVHGVVGYSPWGRKELDMTERLTHTSA